MDDTEVMMRLVMTHARLGPKTLPLRVLTIHRLRLIDRWEVRRLKRRVRELERLGDAMAGSLSEEALGWKPFIDARDVWRKAREK